MSSLFGLVIEVFVDLGARIGAGLRFVHGGTVGAELSQSCVAEGGSEESGCVAPHVGHEAGDVVVAGSVAADRDGDLRCQASDHGADGALEDRRRFRLVFGEASRNEVQHAGQVGER